MKAYEAKIAALKDSIKDFERRNELRDVQEAHLKSIIRSHKANNRRDGVNMEYLKNIVYKYLCFESNTSESQSLVNVIATLLEFSKKERARVMRQQNGMLSYFWGVPEGEGASAGLMQPSNTPSPAPSRSAASTPNNFAQWEGTIDSRSAA